MQHAAHGNLSTHTIKLLVHITHCCPGNSGSLRLWGSNQRPRGVFFSEELPFPPLEAQTLSDLTAFAYYYQLFGEEKANGLQGLSIRELVKSLHFWNSEENGTNSEDESFTIKHTGLLGRSTLSSQSSESRIYYTCRSSWPGHATELHLVIQTLLD